MYSSLLKAGPEIFLWFTETFLVKYACIIAIPYSFKKDHTIMSYPMSSHLCVLLSKCFQKSS